ncbi:MAG: glucose-6-phosphate isomerase [Rhodobacteraceae bacterium]|nr:glucose-6-phosphate isomerase [Paracoccaceae bacterium]
MTRKFTAFAAAALLALAACDATQQQQDTAVGGAVGATLGALSANALGADAGWTAAAAIAAGTAGALYAQNRRTDQCAYYTGRGDEVVVRPC